MLSLFYEIRRKYVTVFLHPLIPSKNKRDKGYSHHFVIISISSVTEELDAVIVGQYTNSGKIFTESSIGFGKFVRETILIGQNKTHDIFDFEKGLYLIKEPPNTEDEVAKAYKRNCISSPFNS
jgi:hypothetical protein